MSLHTQERLTIKYASLTKNQDGTVSLIRAFFTPEFVKHPESKFTLSVKDFGKSFKSFTEQKSNDIHFMKHSMDLPNHNTHCFTLMPGAEYRSDSLFNVTLGDTSYNLLHFLPPPKDSTIYNAYMKEDTDIIQQTLLDQTKRKNRNLHDSNNALFSFA